MRLKEVMNQPVVTCPEDSTLDHAARLMWEYDCGVVPVVDDGGRITGVVTDRDICIAAYTQGRPLATIPVTTAMARAIVAGRADQTVEQGEALMREHQIRRLPVLDNDGTLIGIVSMNDLAREAARAPKNGTDRDFVRTLAAVCEPRARAIAAAPREARA
jgi:CBS domain-containing protein